MPFFERPKAPSHPPRSQSSMSHRRGTSMSHLYMCSTPPPHPTAGLMMPGDMFQRKMEFNPALSLDINLNSFGPDLHMETLSSGKKEIQVFISSPYFTYFSLYRKPSCFS
jgi:hypothetical protein